MKSHLALIVLAALSSVAHAALPKSVPLKQIKPLVSNYLESIECSDGDAIDPKLATRFVDKANHIDGYLAVTTVDYGCAGGSGTQGPALVFIRVASGKEGMGDELLNLKVDPNLSHPIAEHSLPRALSSIYVKDSQLYGTGLEYGKDDANCCPTLKVNYKITLVKKLIPITKEISRIVYTWEVVKQGAR